jgi:hypothetical protein
LQLRPFFKISKKLAAHHALKACQHELVLSVRLSARLVQMICTHAGEERLYALRSMVPQAAAARNAFTSNAMTQRHDSCPP